MATPRTKAPPTTNGAKAIKIHAPRKLDIACGQRKQQGYKGIDIAGDADIVHDLNDVPWPIKTGSVEEVFCAHYIEHVDHKDPRWPKDGWFIFFDELYRVMKPPVVGKDEQTTYATAVFHHPYVKNDRAFWDPTHVRFVHETTWYYLSKEWRQMQGLDHYPANHDFEIVTINTDLQGDLPTRNLEYQNHMRNHSWNAVGDLMVILKRL